MADRKWTTARQSWTNYFTGGSTATMHIRRGFNALGFFLTDAALQRSQSTEHRVTRRLSPAAEHSGA